MKKFGTTLLKFIVFFGIWIAMISLLNFIPIPGITIQGFENLMPAFERLWYEILPLFITLLLTFIFVKITKKDEIKIKFWNDFFKNLMLGCVVGVLWLGITLLVFILARSIHIVERNQVYGLFIFIVAMLLNVLMQEFLVRGYLYQLVKKKYNFIAALVISTLLFTLLHAGAFEAGIVAVLNVITMSVFVTLILEYTNSLLVPTLVHFIWNTIGGILLGVISVPYPNVFNVLLIGSEFITGGEYKMEGSMITLAVTILFIVVFLFLLVKHKKIAKTKGAN